MGRISRKRWENAGKVVTGKRKRTNGLWELLRDELSRFISSIQLNQIRILIEVALYHRLSGYRYSSPSIRVVTSKADNILEETIPQTSYRNSRLYRFLRTNDQLLPADLQLHEHLQPIGDSRQSVRKHLDAVRLYTRCQHITPPVLA